MSKIKMKAGFSKVQLNIKESYNYLVWRFRSSSNILDGILVSNFLRKKM